MPTAEKKVPVNTIAGLIVFAAAPLVFIYSQSSITALTALLSSRQYWLFIFYYFVVYATLRHWVMPSLYLKGKLTALTAVAVFFLCITLLLKPFDGLVHFTDKHRQEHDVSKRGSLTNPNGYTGRYDRVPPHPIIENGRRAGPAFDIVAVFLLVFSFLIAVSESVFKKSRLTEQRAVRAEADKATAELAFLKTQVHPHFLFNTLNNIYALAVTKSEKTADAIMKLSNIMRYITDEVNDTLVPLQHEADCVKII